MAKKNQSSKRKVAVFSIKGWDAAHYKTTDQYAKAVERIMVATTNEIASMVSKKDIDTDKPFAFGDYPGIKKEVDKAVADMARSMTVTIERGSRKEWLSASQKNDAFIQSVMNTSKVSKARLSKMQDKNLDALAAFQSRKVDGMDLSQRVWKYAGQFKDQIEQCIDVGLGEGRSADELSRDVRQNLKDPNRLFRRVRDKRGNLVLSKNARAFHPGQGVYRSSYKNAMRLTRSEINMAYRESDYLRWQQLDFVIGIEIHRSNHDPLCDCDLCARLVGKYPKTFKFKGWHPQCMCYATPVLVSDDEFDAQELSDLKSALHGTEYRKLAVKGEITDVPDGFKDWVKENAGAQKRWSSTPYFIKDNFVDGELAKGLKPAALAIPNRGEPEPAKKVEPEIDPVDLQMRAMQSVIEKARQMATDWFMIPFVNMLDRFVSEKDIDGITKTIKGIMDSVKKFQTQLSDFLSRTSPVIQDARKYGVDCSKLENDLLRLQGSKPLWKIKKDDFERDLQDLINAVNIAKNPPIPAVNPNSKDKPHPALKTQYTTNEDIEDSITKINGEFTKGEKWLENGELKLSIETDPSNNGSTYMDGRIKLQKHILDDCKKVLAKIGRGESDKIADFEARSMCTMWHEITHNRNIHGNMAITDTQRKFMELANEWVARKTLPELWKKLGCAEIPHPEFMTNRDNTSYNTMVNNYDYVIKELGLDFDKIFPVVKKGLFTTKYDGMAKVLEDGLRAGGIKKVDGKPIGARDMQHLLKIVRDGYSKTTIKNWLKQNGYVADDAPKPTKPGADILDNPEKWMKQMGLL